MESNRQKQIREHGAKLEAEFETARKAVVDGVTGFIPMDEQVRLFAALQAADKALLAHRQKHPQPVAVIAAAARRKWNREASRFEKWANSDGPDNEPADSPIY